MTKQRRESAAGASRWEAPAAGSSKPAKDLAKASAQLLDGGQRPLDAAALRANFINNPNNRSYQPRAYANEYTLPEKVYSETVSLQQELPGNMAATIAYVGSQGRNLFLRSIANRTIGVQSNGRS